MGESNGPIAVLLPSYLGIVPEFLELASSLVPSPPAAGPGGVLAFFQRRSEVHAYADWEAMARRLGARPGVELRTEVRTYGDLFATLRAERARLLVLEWEDWTGYGHAESDPLTRWFVRESPCDVAIVKRPGGPNIRQILLPVRGGPQGLLTLRLAMSLADRYDARITLLHVEQPGLRPADDAAVRAQLDALLAGGAEPTRAQPAIVIADSVDAAIAAEAEEHQVTIMGASPGDPGTPLLLGPVAEAVAARAPGTLIIVKARE